MTKITVYQRKEHIIGYQMIGHTGYADAGSDIYCSAISVLAINTANSLETLAGAKLSAEEQDGFIKVRLLSEPDEKSDLLFDSLVLGLRGILDNNGKKFLKVNFEEV